MCACRRAIVCVSAPVAASAHAHARAIATSTAQFPRGDGSRPGSARGVGAEARRARTLLAAHLLSAEDEVPRGGSPLVRRACACTIAGSRRLHQGPKHQHARQGPPRRAAVAHWETAVATADP